MISEDSVEQKMMLLIDELVGEITVDWWRLLLLNHGYTVKDKNHADIFKFCLKNKVIEKDLSNLKICFEEIRKNNLALKMEAYTTSFSQLSPSDFSKKFNEALDKIKEN